MPVTWETKSTILKQRACDACAIEPLRSTSLGIDLTTAVKSIITSSTQQREWVLFFFFISIHCFLQYHRISEIKSCIRHALRSHSLEQRQSYQEVRPGVRVSDLDTLSMDNWLNDIIINRYMSMLVGDDETTGFAALSSFWYEELLKGYVATARYIDFIVDDNMAGAFSCQERTCFAEGMESNRHDFGSRMHQFALEFVSICDIFKFC